MALAEHQLELHECRMRYRRGGTGQPLILLHGAGGADSLLGIAERLSNRFDVILPDHPGFGESEEPAWLDTIHDAAYHYLDFITALELAQIHLVGASLGGWMALEMAVRDTGPLQTLTLIAAAGIRPGHIECGDLFMWSPEEQVQKLVHDQALAARIMSMEKTPEQEEQAIRNHFTTAKLAWEPRFFDPDLHKWLHRINVPTLLIWGHQDVLFPLAYGEKLAAQIPHAQLTVIEECGHLPHVEQPEQLLDLISSFLGEAA